MGVGGGPVFWGRSRGLQFSDRKGRRGLVGPSEKQGQMSHCERDGGIDPLVTLRPKVDPVSDNPCLDRGELDGEVSEDTWTTRRTDCRGLTWFTVGEVRTSRPSRV